jgi:hypothetical protein
VPNHHRHLEFASHVSRLLYCNHSRFEDCYVIPTCIYLMYNGCISHLDKLNPVQNYPYQRTGALNIMLADSKAYIWLLQVVAGWRKVIDHYLSPYIGAVNGITIHFETYLRNLQDDYNKFNDGYTGTFHLN